ncbi:GDP-mannose 4,6 dehydratase domain-containing protein [Phthorimaea operculella]|nr:GDP-mannose 4,6 dehydratase domain-containing protein [Phthorimaea operculella]
MPFMAQVALGKKPVLTVFGSDYNTPDGTGEDLTKEFTNLMPFMAQVALGKKPVLTVFGSDYNTPDGTGEDLTKEFTNLMPFMAQVALGKKPVLTVFGSDYNTPDGTDRRGSDQGVHQPDAVHGAGGAGKKPVLTVFGSDYNTPDGTGEDLTKEFTNLMPFMAQVALGKKPVLTVFGSDYNTPDGTGEDLTKEFTNLMPFMAQVALGKKPVLTVFGSDYNTPDGTGVRDYIHVMDLARGHVAALNLLADNQIGLKVYNLGTGKGVSVKQLVDVFERVTNTKIPLKYVDRRLGDITAMWADATLAKEELGWTTRFGIEEMCTDFWRWQTMNPDGYPKKSKPAVHLNGKS